MQEHHIGYLIGYFAAPLIIAFFLVWPWTRVRGTRLTAFKVVGLALVLLAISVIGRITKG